METLTVELQPEVIELMRLLYDNNITPYMVGGTVRDIILGKPTHDVDLAVNDIDKATSLVRDAGYKVTEEASSFRVIKVFPIPGSDYHVDIAGFRTETYEYPSRKPVVKPARTIEEDVNRRDFTINSMAIEPINFRDNVIVGKLLDFTGGLQDLQKGIIRAVGNPYNRFMEDPLRILRAIRFALRYNFTIDPRTLNAMRELRNELTRVSIERIIDEWMKSNKENAVATLEMYGKLGILDVIMERGLPDTKKDIVTLMKEVKHDNRGSHYNESVFQHTVDAIRRLQNRFEINRINYFAVLLHDIGKVYTYSQNKGKVMFINHAERGAELAYTVLTAWRFSNYEKRIITSAIAEHINLHLAQQDMNRKLYAEIYENVREDQDTLHVLLQLAEVDTGKSYAPSRKIFEEFRNYPRPPLGEWAIEYHVPESKRSAWVRKVRIIQLEKGIKDITQLKRLAKGVSV